MEHYNLKEILKKYENGETNLEEEKFLKDYFVSDRAIPKEHSSLASLFNYLNESEKDSFSGSISLKDKRSLKPYILLVASIFITGLVYLNHKYQKQQKVNKIYAQVEKALFLVADGIDKGQEGILQLENLEKTKNKIFKP